MRKLTTSKEIATSRHSIGVELWFDTVTGEPEISFVNLRIHRQQEQSDIENGLSGDPNTPTRSIFVGKGARRRARRVLERLNVGWEQGADSND